MNISPPGMTQSQFSAALDRFRNAVGGQWVFTDPEDLKTYRDDYSPFWGQDEERLASAAVGPANVEEVQAVVRIANELGVPIYPISTGKNLGYGGAAPNLSGSVVVDLKRMNRIVELNGTKCSALVEPGVSYFDLHNELRERDLPLWIDCPEPGWGSVLGNAVERGNGYTGSYYRDHFGSSCGMEVVLPNGELMRTGMGALPGATTWTDYRYGFGPHVDGLFTHGNYGIVTKMGIHLVPRPEAMSVGVVEAKRYSDIIALVEVLNRLEMSGICDGLPQITSPVTGTFGSPPTPEVTRVLGTPGGPSEADLERIADGRPFWSIRVLSYGSHPLAREKWNYAKSQFEQAVPDCRIAEELEYEIPLSPEAEEALEPHRVDLERKVNFAIPNLSIFSLGARSPVFPTPTDGHIWFSPIIERTGEGLMKMQNVFCQEFQKLDEYMGLNAPIPMCYSPRSFVSIIPVFIDKANPERNQKGLEFLKHLIDVAADNGWGEYRAAPALQEYIMGRYDFGDHAMLRFCEGIKDAVDPNGIMAAGRYGIWPKNMREGAGR